MDVLTQPQVRDVVDALIARYGATEEVAARIVAVVDEAMHDQWASVGEVIDEIDYDGLADELTVDTEDLVAWIAGRYGYTF